MPDTKFGGELPNTKGKAPRTDKDRDFDNKIGIRVRQARLAAGMKQTQLAKAIGVTFQQLQKYEKGPTV